MSSQEAVDFVRVRLSEQLANGTQDLAKICENVGFVCTIISIFRNHILSLCFLHALLIDGQTLCSFAMLAWLPVLTMMAQVATT